MWKYCLDDKTIQQCIANRVKYPNSELIATEFISSIGYNEEKMRNVFFEDMVFSEGSMDEVYSPAEIEICENVGRLFVSTGRDIFKFFLIDIDEDEQFDAEKIGSIIKIINKAFKGGNIIILQCKEKILFGSRYISKFAARDYHFTYWITDLNTVKQFASYNICKKNQKYSYAMYMAYVCQLSLFKHRWWSDVKEEAEGLSVSFVELSKSLSFIVSQQVDSFELLEKAIQTAEFVRTDSKMQEYREYITYDEEDFELYDETEVLLDYLKE